MSVMSGVEEEEKTGNIETPPALSHVSPTRRERKRNARRPVPGKTAALMTNPMSIALMTAWAFSCEGALLLNILADVFQSRAPEFPLVPTIVTSVGLNTLCAIITVFLGRISFRGFRFYQPFIGGQSFVVMQGFGYGILVLTSVMLFVYVEQMGNPPEVYRYGMLTVLGCFSALAGIILMTSLLFFAPKRRREKKSGDKRPGASDSDSAVWWRDLSASPNGEIGIVVSFCVSILVCSSLAEHYPGMRCMSSVLCAVLLILGLFIAHVSIGYMHTPGYRLLMPNAGTFRMSLMQAFAWWIAFSSLHLDTFLYKAGPSALPSLHILGGLSSVISLSVLLLFIRFHRFPDTTQSEISLVGEYGPMVLTVVSVLHTGIVWGLALVLSSDVYKMELQLRQGLVMCQTLSSLLTFTLPPCTHLLGRITFGREYEVWMPFKGPLEFVVLQSAGWTCFGTAIFFATLQITENLHFRFAIIESSLTALSQGFIHASLQLFDEGRKAHRQNSNNSSQSNTSLSASFDSDEIGESSISEEEVSCHEVDRSLVTVVLNGEMLTAILLCTIGLMIRVVVDVAVGSGNAFNEVIRMPTNSLLNISTIISIIVVPLAHISMRKRIYVWRPFVGCGGYVAMQSIGWSIYAINLIIVIINTLNKKRQSILVPIIDEDYYFLEYTMDGLIVTIPLACIIMGAFFEMQALSCRKSIQEREKQEVLELYRVLQRVIPDEEGLRHAEELLKAIAGPRWMEPPATDGVRLIREAEETAQARQEAATHIVTIMSVASALAFLSAAFLAERQPVFTLVFGAAGVAVTTISCFSVHYVYGTFLHRASGRYSFFMPFSGGPTFVTLQAIGWGFYTVSSMLITLSCAEGHGSAIVFVTTGVFSVSAQYCILNSVPRFDPTPRPMSILERNAEGIVAVLALVGSFAFAVVYDLYTQGRVTGMALSLLPITVSAVSTCFAVPLGLVSLKRNAYHFSTSPFSIFEGSLNSSDSEDESEAVSSQVETRSPSQPFGSPTLLSGEGGVHYRQASEMSGDSVGGRSPQQSELVLGEAASSSARRQRSGLRDVVYIASFMAASTSAILVSSLVPFALGYIVYCYAYSGMEALRAASISLRYLLTGFGLAVLVPLFAPGRGTKPCKSIWQRFYNAFCCYSIYSIPTAVVVCSLSFPFVVKTTGASVFASSMVAMSCFSTIPHIHLVSMLVNVCYLGYFLHYHLYSCLFKGTETFTWWKFVVDTLVTAYWPWYFRRFTGQPHVTGSLQSPKMRKFFRRWVYSAVADYFSLTLIVDGKPSATRRREENSSTDNNNYVNLRDPKNKYVFSFHPHGVFPGSAMWVLNTQQWEDKVGSNKEHYVSIHCADVIFAVPMLRDFVLSMGGLAASRRSIEHSLSVGNSSVIVTGGQAEMLHTKYSDTEMHLITQHNGFIRLAMTHRVPLVPIISFSEANVLSNVSFPRLQRYTTEKVGFPFPTIPYGRWYLPLPNSRPLTVVVGRPLLPRAGMDSPTNPEHIQQYKHDYFRQLELLFFKYRAKAGYPNMALVFHNHKELRRVSKVPEETEGTASS